VPIEPFVNVVEAPQHTLLKPRNIVPDIKKSPLDLVLEILHLATNLCESGAYLIESGRHRLVQRCKAVEDIFVFHYSI